MFSWLIPGPLIVAGVVASWLVAQDSPQFELMQAAVMLLLFVFMVAALAFWPDRWTRFLTGARKSR